MNTEQSKTEVLVKNKEDALDEALPCPFCGLHDPKVWRISMDDQHEYIRVMCGFCTATGGVVDLNETSGYEEAVKVWNMRSSK